MTLEQPRPSPKLRYVSGRRPRHGSIATAENLGDDPEIEWIEGFAIWVAVLVVIVITAANDWVKEKQFRKLAEVKDDKVCRLIRSGKEQEAAVSSLVVGDVIHVEAGDEVPADCLLITGTGIAADESSLSGESESVQKGTVHECYMQIQKPQGSLHFVKQQQRLHPQEDLQQQHHHPHPYEQRVGVEQSAAEIFRAQGRELRRDSSYKPLGIANKGAENRLGPELEESEDHVECLNICDKVKALQERHSLGEDNTDGSILMDNICLNSTSVLERQVVPQVASPMLSRLISMASNTVTAVQQTVKQVGSPTECALLQFACDFGFDYQRIREERLLEDTDVSRKAVCLDDCVHTSVTVDPVRDEVPDAVRACQNAGIKVRMVTGDNLETAKQIALQCNIFHPEKNGHAMTGAEFNALVGGVVCSHCKIAVCDCPRNQSEEKRTGRKMRIDVLARPEEFDKIADNLQVLARSQPIDKYVLVVGLKQRRNAVVAVTGDGANDAPALKTADVGFAMGVSGKEVAKRAADIVLLDDNFGSIVKAVRWGRNIYDNIRRFLQFQLTVNVVAVLTALLTVLVLRESPLTAVQMLWVNLIMDSLASLALATEPPTDDLLKRGPHSRDEYLISRIMFRNIVGQAVYQLAVMLLLIFAGDRFIPEVSWTFLTAEKRQKFPHFCEFSDCTRETMPPTGSLIRSGRRYHPFSTEEDYLHKWHVEIGTSRHYTLVFNVFVFMQICNMLNARKINNECNIFQGVLKNKMWMFITILIGCVQALVVQFGNRAMSCHQQGLTGMQWIVTLAFGVGSTAVGYLLRFVPYQWLPEAGRREVHLLDESRTLALASRGRLSSERLSLRLGGGVGLTSEQRQALV
eukprot:XP_028345197.1 plasma membrane calcium-transporting ATPase 2-like [Physeter catodon]